MEMNEHLALIGKLKLKTLGAIVGTVDIDDKDLKHEIQKWLSNMDLCDVQASLCEPDGEYRITVERLNL